MQTAVMHRDVGQADKLQAEGTAGAKKCGKAASGAVESWEKTRQSDGQVHMIKAPYGRLSGVLAGQLAGARPALYRTESSGDERWTSLPWEMGSLDRKSWGEEKECAHLGNTMHFCVNDDF